MGALSILEKQWESLLAMLPPNLDLDSTLRSSGALKRRRAIGDGATLLRLALAYALGGLSLRSTAAWAQAQGWASLSDVALLKRLRGASTWLGTVLAAVLSQRVEGLRSTAMSYRLRVVDATTASTPGSKGTDSRIHMGLDLSSLRIDRIEVTGVEGGESFTRLAIGPGDLILADRGYAHRRGLAAVRQAQADYLVRINWQNLPLEDQEHNRLDLVQLVESIEDSQAVEWEVWTVADRAHSIPPLPARLIVAAKSPEATEAERKRILREAARKGRKADPRSLKMAGFFTIVTSVPQHDLSAQQALDLYRLRWQIEMAFKRIKGLLDLGNLPAKDPRLIQSYLCAKLLAALLLEDLTRGLLDFSPSGSAGSFQARESVASPADLARSPILRRTRSLDLSGAPSQGL